MKTVVFAVLIALCSSTVFAEQTSSPTATQTTDKARDQIHRGNLQIVFGLGLVATGIFVAPLTGEKGKQDRHDEVAGGMVAGGMGLIAWGAWQRWEAVKPQTTLGVMVGDRRGIQILHRW